MVVMAAATFAGGLLVGNSGVSSIQAAAECHHISVGDP